MVGPRFVFNISWLVNYIAINCPHFLKKSIKNLTGRARQTEALDEDSPSACSLSAVWGGGCDCPARRPSLPPSSEWSWRCCVPGTDSHPGSGRREGGGWSRSWSHWTCNIHVIHLSLSLSSPAAQLHLVCQTITANWCSFVTTVCIKVTLGSDNLNSMWNCRVFCLARHIPHLITLFCWRRLAELCSQLGWTSTFD